MANGDHAAVENHKARVVKERSCQPLPAKGRVLARGFYVLEVGVEVVSDGGVAPVIYVEGRLNEGI